MSLQTFHLKFYQEKKMNKTELYQCAGALVLQFCERFIDMFSDKEVEKAVLFDW